MPDKLKTFKNNSLNPQEFTDIEWVVQFYNFLQGKIPDGVEIKKGHLPKLNTKKAATILWYLQEYLSVIPDHFEQCSICKELYDSWQSGHYSEKNGKCYCEACVDHYAPKPLD